VAKDHESYYRVRFSAYAELNGEELDIFGFEVRYVLDEIPQARIFPTVGREPTSGKEAQAVQAFLNAVPYTPLKVYVKMETEIDNPDEANPGFPYNEDVLVFDGYFAGVGYQSMRTPAGGSAASLVCYGMHWLTGLAGSDMQHTLNTVKGPGGFAELANTKGSVLGLFDITSTFYKDVADAKTDLWKKFVKPMFREILDTKTVWGENSNESADEAINKMDHDATFSGDADNTLELRVASEQVPPEIIGKFLAWQIGWSIFKQWQSSNMWVALQTLARTFEFHIVPLIETATCAPVFGALNGDPFKEITTDDYHALNIDARTPAKVSKYVITGATGTMSSPYSPTPRISAVVGIYSAEDAWEFDVRGLTVVAQAPMWLVPELQIGSITRYGMGGDKLAIPDACNPTAFAEEPDEDYQELFNAYVTSELGDAVAKKRLQELIFSERSGSITGRFRLDVAPGSTVAVQVIDDKFAEQGAEPRYVYGLVTGVTLRVSSGEAGATGDASTTLALGYLRSKQEHEGIGDILVSEYHPIYEVRYVGSGLLNASE